MTRIAPILGAALATVLFATSTASAAPSSRDSLLAGSTLDAYMRETEVPCQTSAGERWCTIASLSKGLRIFYDTHALMPGVALAFVDYQSDQTGNAMDQMAILLRFGDRWTVVGRVDNTIGSNPREVVLVPGGAITYEGTIVGPGGSRVDPLGKARFCLRYSNDSLIFANRAKCDSTPGGRAPVPMIEMR